MAGFWSILLGGITIFAGSGLALGAALGLTGLLLLQFSAGGSTFVAVDAVWNVLNSFTLSAIPLFIILGEIMLRSGISERGLCSAHTGIPACARWTSSYQYHGLYALWRGQRVQSFDCCCGRVCCLPGE